nr:ead/Ea22-like family protein [Atlantibacter hermannii]
MNTTELLIQNGQLVANTLRHLADNEIDSDYFAITSASENGTEIEHELVITDYALQAASTVEALVEALESAQRGEQQWKAAVEAFRADDAEWHKLTTSNNKLISTLATALSKQADRIAELEGREVREEGNQFLIVRHPGKAPVIKHCAGNLEGFLRQLLEHESMATIDIVTHRYYGIGGQWVQDADEYLHMMDAAGIKCEVKGE